MQKLLDVILGSADGRPELRRAAAGRAATLGGGALAVVERVPAALADWVERVAVSAWRTTDADVSQLRQAGVDEDAIFEATIAAAVGAGVARYQAAERAMAAAASAPVKTRSG